MTQSRTPAQPSPGADGYLSPRELADLLGVPLATVRAWHRRRVAPPHYRVNGAIRYARAEVEQWLAERHIAPENG